MANLAKGGGKIGEGALVNLIGGSAAKLGGKATKVGGKVAKVGGKAASKGKKNIHVHLSLSHM